MNLNLEALETSFDLVATRGDELMDVFYFRLFVTAPSVIQLFAETDIKRQKAITFNTLVLLCKSLRDLDAIRPKLRELGVRHLEYGAEPKHYPAVGAALLASIAEIADLAWTPEYEQAWSEAFAIVAGAMIEGAETAKLEAAA